MILVDTSVLIPVAQVSHLHHQPSRVFFNFLERRKSAVSAHTMAEVYATLTAMPPAVRLTPSDAFVVIETFLQRLTPVSLSPEEYMETLRSTAKLGHSSGMIYDALHLACARKVNAEYIYTWNLKNFRSLAPDLADRIVTP
jgi:predicted nucleic acid-binding protein